MDLLQLFLQTYVRASTGGLVHTVIEGKTGFDVGSFLISLGSFSLFQLWIQVTSSAYQRLQSGHDLRRVGELRSWRPRQGGGRHCQGCSGRDKITGGGECWEERGGEGERGRDEGCRWL